MIEKGLTRISTLNLIAAWAKEKGAFPEFKDLIEDRNANMENFKNFVEKLLCVVSGKKLFKKEKGSKTVSKICTISDEAFLLVALENSYKAWKAEFDEEDDIPKKVYTDQPASSQKYGGWSVEGIQRYNTYMELVRDEREQPERQEVEKEYLSARQKEQENVMAGGRKRKVTDVKEHRNLKVTIYHPIEDVEESDEEEEEDDDDENGPPTATVQVGV